MTYDLYIGDRLFSSWSLRGWLMLEKFNLPYKAHLVGLYDGTMQDDLAHLAPAKTVPAMRTPEGHVLTDSIAMAETLAEMHPESGLYPREPAARALARSMVAEMHSGFGALRDACPMQLGFCWEGFEPPQPVTEDIARIETLWTLARSHHGSGGPWLFGDYTLADVFYAPVAMRITGFGLQVTDESAAYVKAHLADPALQTWREAALEKSYDPWPYPQDLPRRPWPGDATLPASVNHS